MDTYFGDFEKELGLVEEKLDILSEWHLSKKHHGATEIAEDCRSAISHGFSFTNYLKHIKSKMQAMRFSLLGMLRTYLEN